MRLTLDEGPTGQILHVNIPEPVVEIRNDTNVVQAVNAVTNEKVIVGQAANFAPAGEAGLSAYQIAVSNGFVGTESEWLLSLGSNFHVGDTPPADTSKVWINTSGL